MRRALAAILLLAVAACTPGPVHASPAPASAALAVVADTIRVTSANACVISEPGVACRITVTGTAGTAALAFGPTVTLTPNAVLNVSTTFTCTTPGQPVPIAVQLSAVAVNRSGEPSPVPTISTGTGVLNCRDAIPGSPAQATVTIIITP